MRLSDSELVTLTAAAARAGMALAAYLSKAGMDAAEHSEVQREALAELIRAAELVHRAGTDLNQAAARFHSTGQPGPDLGPAAEYCMRVADRVDQAATVLSRRLR